MFKKIITLILSILTFITLHYFIYLENTNTEIPLLIIYPEMSLDYQEIKLKEEIKPTYLNPLSKFQYIYEDQNGNQIVEETNGLFSGKMEFIQGKDIVQEVYKKSGYIFIKGFAVNEHPSVIFFIIQYLLIITIIINTIKIYGKTKKNHN